MSTLNYIASLAPENVLFMRLLFLVMCLFVSDCVGVCMSVARGGRSAQGAVTDWCEPHSGPL